LFQRGGCFHFRDILMSFWWFVRVVLVKICHTVAVFLIKTDTIHPSPCSQQHGNVPSVGG